MFAQATCPHCELTIRVPIDYAGRSVKCPQCEQRFTVEGAIDPVSAAGPASESSDQPGTNRPPSAANFEALVMEVLSTDDE